MQNIIMAIAMIENADWIFLPIFFSIFGNGYQPARIHVMHVNCYRHSAQIKEHGSWSFSKNVLVFTDKIYSETLKKTENLLSDRLCKEMSKKAKMLMVKWCWRLSITQMPRDQTLGLQVDSITPG
eukprot:TRINITY_DN4807_c0_g1_i1.p1 TRINITY_DN4807_c0_g1~~TRINITY_DN4807_c0_g1_i1.p1  ORF type:complete len:125 (+),score=8.50 TRINITY_DN4807_c0_g1_i1:1007-1381(+)